MGCEPIRSPEGVTGFICSSRRRRRCEVCRTGWATRQCDWPSAAKSGRACDRHVCGDCCTSHGADVDFCVGHERWLGFLGWFHGIASTWFGAVPYAYEVMHGRQRCSKRQAA